MKRLVVFLVASAGAVAIAALFVPSPAASVGAATISRQSLDSDLSAIAGSADYTCFLSEERTLAGKDVVPLLGAGTAAARGGVYDTAFVDDWLSAMITNRVVAALVARSGVRVGPRDVSIGRAVLARRITGVLQDDARAQGSPVAACGGTGAAVLASLPAWFVAEEARAEADQAVLDARAAHGGLGVAGTRAYFSRHRRAFENVCLDVVVVQSQGAASRVERALGSGVTFAAEAAAASVTSTSAAAGGNAGCGVLAGSFLGRAVERLGVGGVSHPFAGDGFWWVVRLAKRSPAPFAAVESMVVTSMLRAGQAAAGREITRALGHSAVSVDPRYGVAASHRLTLVAPPASPPAAALVSPRADVARATAATS